MIFGFVNSKKIKVIRTFLSCVLIITVLATFSSCATTEIVPMKAENVEYGSPAVITKIILKNKLSIDCVNTYIVIDRNAYPQLFNITYSDTIRESNNGYAYKTAWNKLSIPESNINKVYMENSKVSITSAVLIILGLLSLAALAVGIGISQSGFNFR